MHNYSAAKRKTTEEQASDVPQSKKHQLCNAPDVLCLKVFPLRKKCCQGIRGKPGQTTVASIKTWRVSPAEPPWPLTAAKANTHWEQCAMIISQKSQEKEDREGREGGACIFICPRVFPLACIKPLRLRVSARKESTSSANLFAALFYH